jgi:CRP-like cAMP-binding protein
MNSTLNNSNSRSDKNAPAQTIEGLLAQQPFLAGLKPEHLRVLASNAMRMHYQPGEFIFREGDTANRFYLIEHGRVSLESHRHHQPPLLVQLTGPGDALGWSWLFQPYYWLFDARAVEPTTALFFYGTRLREACEQDHVLGYELTKRMTQVVIRRLQATRKRLLNRPDKLEAK